VKRHFPALLLGLGFSTAVITPAAAYPVDCAILLCLAGGWPASAECAHARAVFIRRITPWPIEPPLQIWNCPMRASFRGEMQQVERLFDIGLRRVSAPLVTIPEMPVELQLVQGRADVDISDPAFDFVRSVRVFSVEYARQWWGGKDGECKQQQRVRLGSYGSQGEFSWQTATVAELPERFAGLEGWDTASCPQDSARAVYIEWKDFAGRTGFEQINY
jgi:hypothetical protein